MKTSAILFLTLVTICFHHVSPEKSPEQPHRTAFHFQPPQNWMNDPNGPMYYNGVYHLFYQYNPFGPLFSDKMYWAHSVSRDLINWTPLDLAIAPTQPFDANSCWSGSATILPGPEPKPVILYTGIDSQNRQVQNLAVPKNLSDPYLREWVKYSSNPVINLPDGIQHDDFRDPTTAWLADDGKWRIIVGSQKHKTGIAFLYQSEDFVNWIKHESPLHQVAGTGIWECPDFFPVGVDGSNGVDTSVINPRVKHVLKVGLYDYAKDYYLIGDYSPQKENYVPQNELTLGTLRYDYGKYYASKSFFDPVKKRRILMAWVNESDSDADIVAKGWAGLQSFPRSIWLDRNQKQLIQWPIDEIETLYENEISFENKNLKDGSVHEIPSITAWQADVKISFKLTNLEDAEKLDPSGSNPQLICSEMDASKKGKFGPFGLLALASHDLKEQTAVFFRVFQSNGRYIVLMCSDQSRSSTKNEGLDKTTYGAFVDIDPQEDEISLRTLIDHSIIESFGGGGKTCITARVYPTLAIGDEARLFAFNNGTEGVLISKLSAWSVKKARINIEETIGCASQ